MKRNIFYWGFTVAIILVFTCSLLAQDTYTIHGRITDGQSSPLEFAYIWVSLGQDSTYVVTTGLSTETGKFSLKLPQPGDYILQIQLIGY